MTTYAQVRTEACLRERGRKWRGGEEGRGEEENERERRRGRGKR